MKKIIKSALLVAAVAPALLTTSCIEETFPTDGVTSEQLGSSSKATEALLWEMTAVYNKFNTLGADRAYDWGYGSIMHIRDVMTEDMAIVSSDYDWYNAWEQANYISSQYMSTQFIWNYLWKVVQTTNNVFAATGYESEDANLSSYIGVASAFRASIYLDLAQMYEFLPNEKTEADSVVGLTVPLVTEKTTEEMAKNNPRLPRMEMANFILSDLNRAEANISKSARLGKVMPDLAVVYGLKARLFLWLGQNWKATLSADGSKFEGDGAIVDGYVNQPIYQKAAEYARLAINESGATPLTKDEWLSTTTGFNELRTSSWLWGTQLMKDDRVVTSGLLNWTSWLSSETTFGYAVAGPISMIYSATYNRMSDSDFRKLSYIAPSGSKLAGKEPVIGDVENPETGKPEGKIRAAIPTYGSIKFRPGQGETGDYLVACSVGMPLMRVEEMYLIEAEATAHFNEAQGKSLLTDFMTKYRYSNYSFPSQYDAVDEIVFQKRVELWGEGLNFYDLKRLGYSVNRKKNGTNFYADAQLVSNGRPAWVNFVIVQTEGNSNRALVGYNNPSFDGMYTE